jgi:hypothetical protein
MYHIYSFEKPEIKWEDKIETAFWRGSSTGCGNNIYTNPRIRLAYLTNKWSQDTTDTSDTKIPLLDAQVVQWAYKLKKTEKENS